MPANYVFTQSPYKQLIISNLHTFLIFIYTLNEYWIETIKFHFGSLYKSHFWYIVYHTIEMNLYCISTFISTINTYPI